MALAASPLPVNRSDRGAGNSPYLRMAWRCHSERFNSMFWSLSFCGLDRRLGRCTTVLITNEPVLQGFAPTPVVGSSRTVAETTIKALSAGGGSKAPSWSVEYVK